MCGAESVRRALGCAPRWMQDCVRENWWLTRIHACSSISVPGIASEALDWLNLLVLDWLHLCVHIAYTSTEAHTLHHIASTRTHVHKTSLHPKH